ncbi:PREDICTED: activating transcription factor 7-interacting protein 1-like isoform X2 [Trachymyrmex septentrionalis]|uniref:activating transcription factor 7-interacting protein 1-like isoform X2 n=1 Tax=Trachymyrmex septentrionalis TaxID=34720 RepID=UPI00084EFDF1|nr:PREDICTED: activating transcription factor 7-interacting protein 1-like isoform X2 [Trachymyrmex septentrionalis]
MEKARAGIVDNSESSSTVSSVNRIDIDELSKEKEEELLFCEEEGDDEDTLSDDSLRLRLSDEEDAEQDITVNDTNIMKLKSQSRTIEQPILDTIVEGTLSSDLQQTVEKVSKPNIEKSTQEIYNTVKIPEKSALDEYTPENKQIQDSIRNLENTRATVNESSEKCTFSSSKDLKITDIKNECSASEQHITSKNDNLSIINNCTQTGNLRNAGLTIHNEENLKKTASDNKETITTNICELNKSDNVDSNKSSVNSINIKIYNDEKLSTITTISNSNDDNLKDKIIEKHIKNDSQSSKCSYAESNVTSDYVDLVKSGNSNDNNNSSSYKDIIAHKSKNNNLESVDITESKNTSNVSKITEKVTNILLIQNKNNFSNIKDNTEVRNKDSDTNDKSVIETVNNSLEQTLLLTLNDVNDSDNHNGTKNVDTVIPRRKRIKKTVGTVQDHAEEIQEEKESRREKRKTARNAEEIIKKKYLNSDSDSNDNTEQLVINNKLNQDIIPVPPLVAIKRNCSESEVFNGIKKAKMNINSEEKKDVTQLSFIEKFFRRDIKEKLPKLTQEELEELLIQKIVETIAMRSEIGQLREQARISEKYQEITRTRMEQLMKQVKDFETVLDRNKSDRRANPNKSIAPIKINRSVGLQVNFITEHGIQNLRQTANLKSAVNIVNNSSSPSSAETNNNSSSLRRSGIKVRSPRPVVTMPTPVTTQSSAQTAPLISTVTPAALVVAKPLESQHTLTLSNQPTNMKPILTTSQQQIQSQSQAIVLNGKISQVNRPIAPKPRNNDLIDLTDEEEKNKSNAKVTTVTTTPIIEQPLNVTPKSAQSFPRVLQTIPANVAITTQPTSIKVITTSQQPAPTALVNNVNPPRLAYVMQSSTGSPRQVLIASNPNQQVQIRPVMNTPNRPPFSTVTYKGISTITNGTVRVLTTPVLSNVQISKHPAPLPDIPNYAPTPGWKLPPPAPSLKISKVSNGIVLSWNMSLSDKYADIASYQLYAYQEVAGVNPNTSLWKKVGDVRALPLPMACTLTQFSEGNNYYFAVRAVDTHSRKGQYSMPGNISL